MSYNAIKVSAPGKVILHGEHAVVYGKSAIAASVNVRSHLDLSVKNDGQVTIDLPAIDLRKSWSVQEIMEHMNFPLDVTAETGEVSNTIIQNIKELIGNHGNSKQDLALMTFLYLYTAITSSNGNLPAIEVKIHSDIPIGAGLGSSASLSVCLVTALLLQQGLITKPVEGPEGQNWSDRDLDLINKWAFQGEMIIHGRPSGIDNSVATFGGAIKFQGGKIAKLEKMPSLRIVLTNTGVARNTKDLVAGVREKYERHPRVILPVLESIEAVSESCQACYSSLVSGDEVESHYRQLEELIDFNQHLLEVLGVSHAAIGRICQVTSNYGLHSKLTGAGGGGCCITLLRPDTPDDIIEKIKTELGPEGFEVWETSIGGPGVELYTCAG